MNTNKLEIWKERIQQCKSSGLTVSQWCDNNQVTKAKYYYWHKIITTSGSESAVGPVFAEVVIKNKDLLQPTIKVSYKDVEMTLSSKNDIAGSKLKIVGKKLIRTEVAFVPTKLKVKQIVQQVVKCTKCGTKDSEHPKDHFQKAAVPASVLSHSIATPSLVAQVMYQKFAMGIPLNRQESDFHRMGLILPRSNMAHWVIRCSDEWLTPIYNRIHEELLKCDMLHMDETRIQVNKEEGKKASSQSWMWVIQSGLHEAIKATFFHYACTRSSLIPQKLLRDFTGYLMTDAYIGYDKVEGIKRSLCWAHCRRYFVESIPLDNRGKEIPGSKGAEGREFINLPFKLEEEMKHLSIEKRQEKRQEASRAVLDAFWSWVEITAQIPTTNELLTKALGYVQNQRKYLDIQTFYM